MAVIVPTMGAVPEDGTGALQLIQWGPMGNADTATQIQMGQWADRCVQVSGTFGAGGVLAIAGSNDGTNWATLNNAQGTALSFNAPGIRQVIELPRYLRPIVSGGDGTTSITVSMIMRRMQAMKS